MSDELRIQRSRRCGHALFAERLACSRCGSPDLDPEPAGPGAVVDAVEDFRAPSGAGNGPVRIVLVELDSGPRLLARTAEPLESGDRVSLEDIERAATASRLRG